MKCFVDWSCRLLPHMRGNVETVEEALDAITLIESRHGINRFFATPTFDSQREPISHFLLRRDRAAEELSAVLPAGIKLACGATVLVNPALHETEGLERLLLHGRLLPIELPITEHADWIDLEINRLLYQRKYNLLFLSMERSIALYPTDAIEKLLRIESAIFQFNFRALTNPACCRVINTLLHRNRTVLLGTEIDLPEAVYGYDLRFYLQAAGIHPADLQALLRGSNGYWKRLGL